MATPQPEISLDQWIEYCEQLSATQNFLLIGLLSKSQITSLNILQAQPLETEENWNAAKEWILKQLRGSLKIYCDNYKKYQIEIGAEAGKTFGEMTKDFIKDVAPAIAYATSGVKGLGVAFVVWLLKYALDKWCSIYADKKYSGKGNYSRLVPKSSLEAFFDVTYTPPIIVYSEDEDAWPLNIPKEQLIVPAQTICFVRTPDEIAVFDIISSFEVDKNHSFEFKDVRTEKYVRGGAEVIRRAPEIGAHVLRLVVKELNISTSDS